MRQRSRKAKGRRLQNYVRDRILKQIEEQSTKTND